MKNFVLSLVCLLSVCGFASSQELSRESFNVLRQTKSDLVEVKQLVERAITRLDALENKVVGGSTKSTEAVGEVLSENVYRKDGKYFYRATDNGTDFVWNGSAWDRLAAPAVNYFVPNPQFYGEACANGQCGVQNFGGGGCSGGNCNTGRRRLFGG